MNPSTSPGGWQLTRFFVPLAIQAASQALTHPLVAMVASRGPGGPLNLAGLAQSTNVTFFLGMFAISLITTGMVYAKTREGYRKFWIVTILTGLAVAGVQAVLCIPYLSHILYARIISLPPTIAHPAKITMLASVPLQFLFFMRIPYQVAMYNGKATGKASIATIGRILITAVLSPLFCIWGLTGPLWAVVCLTLPVGFEVLSSWLFARPFIKALQPSASRPPTGRQIFIFNLPLSVGGYCLAISGIIVGAFIARAAEPERILPVYYLALGLVNPVSYAATRLQAVVLAFPPVSPKDRFVFKFSIAAGAFLGILPLIFILPGLLQMYYVKLQNLNPTELPLVRITAVSLIFLPFSVAFRAYSEGLAAWLKKPMTVLAGHTVFLMTIIVSGMTLLLLGVPGYFIGAVGPTAGSFASYATMRLSVRWAKERSFPVAQTTTSAGQTR